MPPLDESRVTFLAKEAAEALINKKLNSFFIWIVLLLLANLGGMAKIGIMVSRYEQTVFYMQKNSFTKDMAEKAEYMRKDLNPTYIKVDINTLQKTYAGE